jgi:multidrug efflux pump subunit AcrA (membrane-fusion protein)
MAVNGSPEGQRRLGRAISIAIILSAAITGVLVLRRVTANPRTDDAEVFANYIGMAPLVNGPITHLYVSDNQLVKQGDPLFDIDDRPYAYALAHAKSDQQAFKGEISDEGRAGKPRCARFTCWRPRLSNSASLATSARNRDLSPRWKAPFARSARDLFGTWRTALRTSSTKSLMTPALPAAF